MAVWNEVQIKDFPDDLRLDAEFFKPEYVAYESRIKQRQFVCLSDVAGMIQRGYQPTYDEDGTIPVIRTVNVRELKLSTARREYVTKDFLRRNPRGRLVEGDILITSTGIGTLGRVGYLNDDADHFADGHISYVRDLHDIDPLYLTTFLQTRIGRALIERRQRGSSGQMEVYTADLATIPIPRKPSLEVASAKLVRSAYEAIERSTAALAAAEARLMSALGLDGLDLSPSKCYSRRFRDMQAERRFDAEYFIPKYQNLITRLRKDGRTLADVAPLAQRQFSPALCPKDSTFDYIEIGSLTGDGEAEAQTLNVADAPSRATWIVNPGDVITSLVRPIRRLSAMIGDHQGGCVCSSGFSVLSPKPSADGIEPEVLLTYLRLPLICELLDLNTTASMYPAIPVDRLMNIPIVVPDTRARKAIVAKVQDAIAARREAANLLEKSKQRVESLIAGNGREGA